MENFVFYNPTKLHFGKGIIAKLGKTIKKYGNKVLLIYGQSSIKYNGIYHQIISELNKEKISFIEYGGIRPNPIIEDVYSAISLGKLNNIEVVLAVGGGSVIDSAKIIAAGIPVKDDVWDYFNGNANPNKTLPLITVLTIAATGSEMNSFAVIQNNHVQQKIGIGSPLLFPKESFLDPEFTYSVSKHQTACGISDIISHCLEYWFGHGNSPLIDEFIISIIKEVKDISTPLLNDLTNYELRSRMLITSTMALNGITSVGKTSADCGVHDIAHTLSVLYDIPHGEALAITYPAWLKTIPNREDERLHSFSKNIFPASNIENSIKNFETFLKNIGLDNCISKFVLNEDDKCQLIETLIANKVNGQNYKITNKNILKLTKYIIQKPNNE